MLSKYYPKLWAVLGLSLALSSCQKEDIHYQRSYTDTEREALSDGLLNGAGTDLYYQGTVGERMIIEEGNRLSSGKGSYYREMGVPYLKRGMGIEAEKWYGQAVEADPLTWAGYKAYCWLYFYRDYKSCITECDRLDPLTPDFVDYPQSTSVDYMRGISYLQLGQYDKALDYLQRHLDFEVGSVGEAYVDQMPFLAVGMTHMRDGRAAEALATWDRGLLHNSNNAELHYYRAKVLVELGRKSEAAQALDRAAEELKRGNGHQRPYVEEFFAIYPRDIARLRKQIT